MDAISYRFLVYRNHVNISISALIAPTLYARFLIRNVQWISLNLGTLELCVFCGYNRRRKYLNQL